MKTNIYSNDPLPSENAGMHTTHLMNLFEYELKDIFWAEKASIRIMPVLIQNSSSDDLKQTLENHLEETKNQVNRLMQIFDSLGVAGTSKKCEAMEGILREAENVMLECEVGPMRDAGIISSAQKIEHYEIASYGTLRQFAETLGLYDVAELLTKTLEEEKAADEELSEIAITSVNLQAANIMDDEIN